MSDASAIAASQPHDEPRRTVSRPMTSQQPAARYAGPEYTRLFAAARRHLERTGGDLSGTITLSNPDDMERKAIIGITGSYRPDGVTRIAVRLTVLDQAIREATAHSLTELLESLGPALKDRPAARQRLELARDTATRSAESSVLNDRDWFRRWLGEIAADGTLTRLVNVGEQDKLQQAVRTMEALEALRATANRPEPGIVQLAELAAEITGDTKALNHGTTLATLVLRALAIKSGTTRPATTEQRRDLWDAHAVIVDDLASRVLVLNLPARGEGLGEWLTGARTRGTPFYITLQQLVTMPVTPAATTVYVCENPAVLRRAAADLGAHAKPLICTEGQPSTAFHRLAAAITKAGGQLRYHGDFDWPGVAIAAAIMTRHNVEPWRFTAADYQAAIAMAADHVRLSGAQQPTPWDPALTAAMADAAVAVYEESVADALIADLRLPRPPWLRPAPGQVTFAAANPASEADISPRCSSPTLFTNEGRNLYHIRQSGTKVYGQPPCPRELFIIIGTNAASLFPRAIASDNIARVPGFDVTMPNMARVYDYWLGGRDNFAVDRDLANRMLTHVPGIGDLVRENKKFQARAVSWIAALGVTQFIDLGCGLPTTPATHEIAIAANPAARVAYLDNDPVVLSHLLAYAAKEPAVTVLDADLRDTDAVLAGIDTASPACLIAGCVLHIVPPDAAAALLGRYLAAMAPGSYAIVSIGLARGEPGRLAVRAYTTSGLPFYHYSAEQFAALFDGLDLVPPGVTDSRAWHPGATDLPALEPRVGGDLIVGVARKP